MPVMDDTYIHMYTHFKQCVSLSFNDSLYAEQKTSVICILALALTVNSSILAHHVDQHDHSDIHYGHSSSIVIDDNDAAHHHHHHHIDEHPVYHHDAHYHDVADINVHRSPPAKIIHHEPIHQEEPVHHVTKVVHHEPHHFLHYTNPVIDHHVVHENQHIDDHHHAAQLVDHHHDYHAVDYRHHHAPISVHHHGTAALVHHHSAYPVVENLHLRGTHANLLSFAKHQLHGKYGKVKITKTHY